VSNHEVKILSRDVLRAEEAASFIRSIKVEMARSEITPEKASEIRVEIEALPAKIMQNGLLQALLYLLDLDKKDRSYVGETLLKHLAKGPSRHAGRQPSTELALDICRDELFLATEEALEFVRWLKLLAKAEIPKAEKQSQGKASPTRESSDA